MIVSIFHFLCFIVSLNSMNYTLMPGESFFTPLNNNFPALGSYLNLHIVNRNVCFFCILLLANFVCGPRLSAFSTSPVTFPSSAIRPLAHACTFPYWRPSLQGVHFCLLIPGRCRIFFLLQHIRTVSGAHTAFYAVGTGLVPRNYS